MPKKELVQAAVAAALRARALVPMPRRASLRLDALVVEAPKKLLATGVAPSLVYPEHTEVGFFAGHGINQGAPSEARHLRSSVGPRHGNAGPGACLLRVDELHALRLPPDAMSEVWRFIAAGQCSDGPRRAQLSPWSEPRFPPAAGDPSARLPPARLAASIRS